MRATLRLGLVLAVGILISGPARGQDGIDDVKRQIKIATDKLIADIGDGIARADKEAKTSVRNALEELGALEIKFQFAKLVPEETRSELAQRVKSRINFYRQAQSRGDTRYDLEERYRMQQERYDRVTKKNAELQQLANQSSQLFRQGKFEEAAKLNQQMADKFGSSPSTVSMKNLSQFRKAYEDVRSLKDERNVRSSKSMQQIIRSSMPVVTDSGMEFPANWKELTKRRTEIKLEPEEVKLLKALNMQVMMEFKGQPLQGVLDKFEKDYGVRFSLDKPALDQLQITSDTPVNAKSRNSSLRSVLKQMLADNNLTYIIRKGEIFITTPERASQFMVVRSYYVGDLVTTFNQSFDPFGQNQLAAVQSIASLIQMVQGIEPQSWQANGNASGGTIAFDPIRMAIIVKQSAEMHFMLQGSFR